MTDTLEDIRRWKAEAQDERVRPDISCPDCRCDEWRCIGYDAAYGADADGRRGRPLREWECGQCGYVVSTMGY